MLRAIRDVGPREVVGTKTLEAAPRPAHAAKSKRNSKRCLNVALLGE